MLIFINLVEYKLWCIPKHSRMLQMKLLYLGVVGDSAGGPRNAHAVKWLIHLSIQVYRLNMFTFILMYTPLRNDDAYSSKVKPLNSGRHTYRYIEMPEAGS